MASRDGGMSDVKPGLDASVRAGETISSCSLTSGVMEPPTYPPRGPTSLADVEELEDVDRRIRDIKSKIETELEERRRQTPPFVAAPVARPPPERRKVASPTYVHEDEGSSAANGKTCARGDVVLDPASGRVVEIASLPWHQRFALTHPYFRHMPYVPAHVPPVSGASPSSSSSGPSHGHPPGASSSSFRGRGGRAGCRVAPLVRYIPGGSKDVNRRSVVNPVDFSSELMSYVRMRKEMLKMDLREKIRQRKGELLRNQKAAFFENEASSRSRPCFKEEQKYRQREEASGDRDGEFSRGREPSPQPKTPRQLWQAKMREARQRSRSSSSSSSSSSDGDGDSRRKWIAQRKAVMMAKTALIKEKIIRAKSIRETRTDNAGHRSHSSDFANGVKVDSSPLRTTKRSSTPRFREARDSKHVRDH